MCLDSVKNFKFLKSLYRSFMTVSISLRLSNILRHIFFLSFNFYGYVILIITSSKSGNERLSSIDGEKNLHSWWWKLIKQLSEARLCKLQMMASEPHVTKLPQLPILKKKCSLIFQLHKAKWKKNHKLVLGFSRMCSFWNLASSPMTSCNTNNIYL